MSPRSKVFKKCVALAVASWFLAGGVEAADLRKDAMNATNEVSKGTAEAPFKTVTNFTPALRCMDNMFITYGIRDVSILLEDLEDQTKKVNVGTKDMVLTTTSAMTRRSRAIRFIAFGGDARNAASFMDRAENKGAYANLPQFGLRGSISQFDDNLAKASKDVGFGLGEWLTFGKSKSVTSKMVAIDLTIMNLADFSIVPGVSSRNGVVIFGEGQGIDGEARYSKFGINYATSLSKSEGTAVAVRNLLELASVELLGKLTKVPYWKCLGVTTPDEEIKTEVEDWFEGMAANGNELFAWWQYQMYTRGTYTGEVNGIPSPAFAKALRDYKVAMGLESNTDLNADFMMVYLQADHAAAMARYEAMKPKPGDPNAPIATSIRLKGGDRKLKVGDKVELELTADAPSHAHCFMMDDNRKVLRIHPNRFTRNTYVAPNTVLSIPDSPKFSLVAPGNGVDETVECYVASKELFDQVPPEIGKSDLVPLAGVTSLQQVRVLFEGASTTPVSTARFVISPERRN